MKLKRLQELERMCASQHAEILRIRKHGATAVTNKTNGVTEDVKQTKPVGDGDGDGDGKPADVANMEKELQRKYAAKENEWRERERETRILLDSFRSLSKEKCESYV